MNLNTMIVTALLAMPVTGLAGQHAPSVYQGRASVVDGDTLEVARQRIRLWGVDAVESSQTCINRDGRKWRCGATAANQLSEFIGSRHVTCVERDRDRYKRVVATCEVGGVDLGQWIVMNGWALAYRRYSVRYVPTEVRARSAGVGVHATTYTQPWDYRREASQRPRRTPWQQ